MDPKGPPSSGFPSCCPLLLLSTSENFFQNFFPPSLPSFPPLPSPPLFSFVSPCSRAFPCHRIHSWLSVSYWTPAMWSIPVHGPNPNGIHWWQWLSLTTVWSITLTYLRFSKVILTLLMLSLLSHISVFFLSFNSVNQSNSVNQYLCAIFLI